MSKNAFASRALSSASSLADTSFSFKSSNNNSSPNSSNSAGSLAAPPLVSEKSAKEKNFDTVSAAAGPNFANISTAQLQSNAKRTARERAEGLLFVPSKLDGLDEIIYMMNT